LYVYKQVRRGPIDDDEMKESEDNSIGIFNHIIKAEAKTRAFTVRQQSF